MIDTHIVISKLIIVPMIAATVAIISDTVWLALITAVSTTILALIQLRTRKVVDAVVTKVDTVAKEAIAVATVQGEKQAEIYTKVDGNLSSVSAQLQTANKRIADFQELVAQLVEKKTQVRPDETAPKPQAEESLAQIEVNTDETARNTTKTDAAVAQTAVAIETLKTNTTP